MVKDQVTLEDQVASFIVTCLAIQDYSGLTHAHLQKSIMKNTSIIVSRYFRSPSALALKQNLYGMTMD